MARTTTWVLALLVTGVAAGNGARLTAQQVRPTATQNGAKDSKENKDKPSTPGKPDDRERWKW